MAVISTTSRGVNQGYLYQMRDAHRDMPLASDRLRIAELRTLANYWRHRMLRSRRSFTLAGHSYQYYFGRYNTTWHNERAVEVPIAWEIVRNFEPQRILEVGNVLPHYFRTSHTVLDKDEAAPGVVNQDVIEFATDRRFDLILSISTLEHVGWDYGEEVDQRKILVAIERLGRFLSANGRLVVTLPIGYNPHLDELLHGGDLRFDRLLAMQRVSRDNRWREASWTSIASARYGEPYRGANGLVIGVIGADGATDLPGLGPAAQPARRSLLPRK